MADLLALIDERIGRLEGRAEKPYLRSLKMRIIAAINDPRYHFMFSIEHDQRHDHRDDRADLPHSRR